VNRLRGKQQHADFAMGGERQGMMLAGLPLIGTAADRQRG
jgi:hypothetical protein